jgi:glycosyltransferase involved in cell wall biosynthesis
VVLVAQGVAGKQGSQNDISLSHEGLEKQNTGPTSVEGPPAEGRPLRDTELGQLGCQLNPDAQPNLRPPSPHLAPERPLAPKAIAAMDPTVTLEPLSPAARPISLSVVIPNYNHAEHVADAIHAAARQSVRPDEIIVVDDGSTDDSLQILEGLKASYPELRIVALPENVGAIGALNRGLKEATSSYVYFGAADDQVKPGLFESLFDLASRHPEAAFACAEGEVVDMDTGRTALRPPVRPVYGPRYLAPDEVADRFLKIDNWILTGAAVVRRDLITRAGGFDPSLGALADAFALRRLAFIHGCCYVPFCGLIWQIRATGVSRAQSSNPAVGLNAVAIAVERMRNDPAFPSWYPEAFERRWRFGVSRIAALSSPMNTDVLDQVGARGPIGRAVLTFSARVGGPVGRVVALGWLTIRERPTSFTGLILTAVSRWRASPSPRRARTP